MASPFKFYIENGSLVREWVAGEKTGEKSTFRNMAEVANYIDKTNQELWACRSLINKHKDYKEVVTALADQIKSA